MQVTNTITQNLNVSANDYFAAPQKVQNFKQVLEIFASFQGKKLLVLDLDECVFEARTDLGTEEYLKLAMDKMKAAVKAQFSGHDVSDDKVKAEMENVQKPLKQKVFDTHDAIRTVIPFGPTEPQLPTQLQQVLADGHDIIGLTSRVITASNNMFALTEKNLKESGMPFSAKDVLFYNKVTKEPKGVMLQKFLEGKDYQAVVFVDDNKDHAENVFKTLQGRAVSIHYAKPKRVVNPQVIEVQEKAYHAGQPIPSNEDALAGIEDSITENLAASALA